MKSVFLACVLLVVAFSALAQTQTGPATGNAHTHTLEQADTAIANLEARVAALEAGLSSLTGAFNTHVLGFQGEVAAGQAQEARVQTALDELKCALDPALAVCGGQ